MKRFFKYIIICLSIALAPFAAFIVAGESCVNNYANSFTASLVDKYELLKSTNDEKIVFVGGSSLPFGLRSDILELELGVKVVDLGVYAALGTKAMMEISLANLNAGDVVILAPELEKQTYSLYFNADVAWRAANLKREIFSLLSLGENVEIAYNYFDFLFDKLSISGGAGVSSSELYSRTSFNEYGDIDYPRPYNVMPNGKDITSPVTLGLYDKEFIDYVNDYAKKLQKRGVDVYFTFSPTNAAAAKFDEEQSLAFSSKLKSELICEVLASPFDFTYDQKYFYNTNYHLNDSGALLHTAKMVENIKVVYGINTPTDIFVPEPQQSQDGVLPYDENEKCFIAEEIGGVLYLTGVKEEYRSSRELTLPTAFGGRKVLGVYTRCFEGCRSLEKLSVPNCYRIFDAEIFYGCEKLSSVYFETENPGSTSIPDEGLFDGAAEYVKAFVKADQYSAFISNYTWSKYRKYINKY